MLKHYLTVAFRNLSRARGESFVSIAGLAAGMTACLLCLTYIIHETAYDRFHAHASRIYRVSAEYTADGRTVRAAVTPGPLARVVLDECPEAEYSTRLMSKYGAERCIVSGPAGTCSGQRLLYGEPGLFDIFSFTVEWRAGGASLLGDPNTAVIREDAALRYFGSTNPLGKTISITTDETRTYTVAGVMKPSPGPTHIAFDIIVSLATIHEASGYLFADWKRADFHTYILLTPGADPVAVEKELNGSMRKYIDPGEPSGMRFVLERVSSIHLGSRLDEELEPPGRMADVVLCGIVALFVLLVALANHMNIAAGNAESRTREAALRIASGAGRWHLAGQFAVESALIAIIAFCASLSLAELLMPWFGSLTGRQLETRFLRELNLFLSLAATAALVGLISGARPAVMFASSEPAAALRGGKTRGRHGISARSVLVTVQFILAAALMIAGIVTAGQLAFMRKGMDVFHADRIEVIPLGSMGPSGQMSRMKERISGLPGVVEATTSSFVPGDETVSMYEFNVGGPGGGRIVTMRGASADAGFLSTYGIPLVAGRNFTPVPSGLDEDEFIINETAAKVLGWSDPLGKTLSRGYLRGVIVGVARDFPVRSLRDRIEPLFLVRLPARDRYVSVRFEPGDHTRALERVRGIWRESVREVPFAPFLLSDRLDELYGPERRMAGLFGAGAALALILACAGMFGLTACIGERRRVEIGVRKAFGASRVELFRTLAGNQAMMVAAAFTIAAPTAWFIVQAFLGAYPYKASIPFFLLAAGYLAVAVAAGIAAGYPAFRTASESPSDTLRHE